MDQARAGGAPQPSPNAGHAIGRGLGRITGKQLRKLEQQECRQELFQDLSEMPWEDKCKILGHLKEARRSCNENHVVRVLSQIPPDPTGSRKDGLKYINDHLPGGCIANLKKTDESQILLELLDDNGAAQELVKIKGTINDGAQRATDRIRGLREKLAARREARERRP